MVIMSVKLLIKIDKDIIIGLLKGVCVEILERKFVKKLKLFLYGLKIFVVLRCLKFYDLFEILKKKLLGYFFIIWIGKILFGFVDKLNQKVIIVNNMYGKIVVYVYLVKEIVVIVYFNDYIVCKIQLGDIVIYFYLEWSLERIFKGVYVILLCFFELIWIMKNKIMNFINNCFGEKIVKDEKGKFFKF